MIPRARVNWSQSDFIYNSNFRGISMPRGYVNGLQTSVPYRSFLRYGVINCDSSDSPPLSNMEIQDIMCSNQEYLSLILPVYDTVDDFIRDLMEKRREYQTACI